MELSRRAFLAGAGLTAAAGAAMLAETPWAWADEVDADGTSSAGAEGEAPVEGENEKRPFVCTGCPAGCTGLATFDFDRLVRVGGEAANPFTEGKLCLFGQQLLSLRGEFDPSAGEVVANPRRLSAPRVRRPGSSKWEDISWDMALSEIAVAVKDMRDATFTEREGDVPVMRTEAIASFGGARLVAEEQYLLAKMLRSWGVVHLDNEAMFGRRAFAAGCEATFGIGAPDGLLSDIPHAGVILTVGSDHGASCPITLRWIERARERGARWVVLDPLLTRTAEAADVHVALRPGTDVAFFGGLIKYLMEGNRWQPEYVLNYTNASYLVGDGFSFDASAGLFSGWDPVSGTYDQTAWAWRTDGFDTWNMRFDGEFAWVRGEGVPVWSIPTVPRPVRDITLQDPASVWMQMLSFYSRYDLDTVSAVCGVDRETLETVYGILASTATPEGAAKMLAGPGLVQHATGVQAVRAAAVAQLLLGNIGVVGGGMAYMGGVAGDGTADLFGLASMAFPGGLAWPTAAAPNLQAWLETVTAPAGMGAQASKTAVSALKEWWGPAASFENEYGYGWLPKQPVTGPESVFDAVASGSVRGCFVWSTDMLAQAPGAFSADSLSGLEWLVVADDAPSRTASFWNEVEDATAVGTTVYQLPVACGIEKAGMRSSGSRLVQYADALAAPEGEARAEASLIGELRRRVYNLYDTKGGVAPDPLLNVKWDYEGGDGIDLARVAWALNGYQIEGTDFDAGKVLLIENRRGLRADGSVACAVGPFAGCWSNNNAPTVAAEQPVGRRDVADEGELGLFSGWGFTWPDNVRVRGNRASANLAGQPWVSDRNLLYWDGQTWVAADAPDFPALREGRWLAPDNCAFPGVWEKVGLLFSDLSSDGPLPEHYEPLESPLNNRLNTSYASPVYLAAASRRGSGALARPTGDGGQASGEATVATPGAVDTAVKAVLAPDYSAVMADRNAYPIAAVINNGRPDEAAGRALSEPLRAARPGFFVEMSEELARIRGLAAGDTVRVRNERGAVEAPVLVTARLKPFLCEGSEAHYVVLNGMEVVDEVADAGFLPTSVARGWSILAPGAVASAGCACEHKGFLVDVEKA